MNVIFGRPSSRRGGTSARVGKVGRQGPHEPTGGRTLVVSLVTLEGPEGRRGPIERPPLE